MSTAGRKAKRITIEEMKEILCKKCKQDKWELAAYDAVELPKVYADLSKINFSNENMTFQTGDFRINASLGFQHINGLTFLMGVAGGDWEEPLAFAIYVDPKGNLRGYVPTDGNSFNHEHKCAYGSEDYDFMNGEEPPEIDEIPPFDNEKMFADICNRIAVVD